MDLNTRTNGSQWALMSIPTAGCSSATLTPYQKHFYWRQKDGLSTERNWRSQDLGNFLGELILHFPFCLHHSLPSALESLFRSLRLSFLWHWLILLQPPKIIVLVCGWLTTQHAIKTMLAGYVQLLLSHCRPICHFLYIGLEKAVMSRVYQACLCIHITYHHTHTHTNSFVWRLFMCICT